MYYGQPMFERMNMRLQGVVRFFYVTQLATIVPFYIVNEHPKSGGTWLSKMLAECLEVPFPMKKYPSLYPSILHGHYGKKRSIKNVIVLWRDGRDCTISWYYHCLFQHVGTHSTFVSQTRNELQFENYEDISVNLDEFIRYQFTRQRSPRFNWTSFVDEWYGHEDVIYTSYEKLRAYPKDELMRIVNEFGVEISDVKVNEIVDKYSFENMSGRKIGEQDNTSFMRKGVIVDWKNYFSKETKEIFDYYAGEQLIRLGYEKDRSWIE